MCFETSSRKPIRTIVSVEHLNSCANIISGTAHEIQWVDSHNTRLITTSRSYDDGLTVTFTTFWPDGAAKTSLVEHTSNPKANEGVIVNFPALSRPRLTGTLSWAGSFVSAQYNSGTSVRGPTGGPTVFFNKRDANLSTVVVLSPLDNFKASSAGPGVTWDNSTVAYVPGTAGTITSIPPNFSHTFVLRVGKYHGITAAIGEWGEMLQKVHKTRRVHDVTLEKIGYQTDNGAAVSPHAKESRVLLPTHEQTLRPPARLLQKIWILTTCPCAQYVFCPRGKDCSSLLLETVKRLASDGVPMGYLSYQGAGTSTFLGNRKDEYGMNINVNASWADQENQSPDAPWCVNEWGPDLNESQRFNTSYPMSVHAFWKALGLPLQLCESPRRWSSEILFLTSLSRLQMHHTFVKNLRTSNQSTPPQSGHRPGAIPTFLIVVTLGSKTLNHQNRAISTIGF